jgi:ribonucleoside-diphosphate reductase alpha chain
MSYDTLIPDDATKISYNVIRRNGDETNFDINKIKNALIKAFVATTGDDGTNSAAIHQQVEELSKKVWQALSRSRLEGSSIHIEDIQDQVELSLMRAGEQKIARAYVLYREKRNSKRVYKEKSKPSSATKIHITKEDGTKTKLDTNFLRKLCQDSTKGLTETSADLIYDEIIKNLFDGIAEKKILDVAIMVVKTLVDKNPNYGFVASRILLYKLRTEVMCFLYPDNKSKTDNQRLDFYKKYFKKYIQTGCRLKLLDERLNTEYDIDKLALAIKPERDLKFNFLGLQTLYDRYLIHKQETRIELPQAFFMRVAMGLAINEIEREKRTIEFYNLLSSFDFMCSTPTLFNSGTLRPQLSSCYLTTIPDDLDGIFEGIKDDALLSKFAGGLGNDWTQVRAMGSHIKGTNGKSQGVVPFLKVANDTAVAVNQGGKRKGAMCAYLETWHLDIEDFLELRKNTGDERRRTHDMNTANWIPDLFMERVIKEDNWTLFSPEEVPELHNLYGDKFTQKYTDYEKQAKDGKIKLFKTIPAIELWRKMLGMLFETGHPWITFKDPCNIRSPQQHMGVVHSSNLCTEITLNTNEDEIAVCNLGSINLPAHTEKNGINSKKLQKTIKTAMRILDNVIDYNYYSVNKARRSNLKHRPVGIGLMGFVDSLYKQKIAYASDAAIQFADTSMEQISYFAIEASADLAAERGSYNSFAGSAWSLGILPIDSLKHLKKERADYLQIDTKTKLDWDKLRNKIKKGMRNSNTMAIAPTATISNICGVSQSIEPTYQNLFVKSNLSGEFTVINPYLVQSLKEHNLWDDLMINDLKFYDGSLQQIKRIPQEIKDLYKCAFEIDPRYLIEAAARRQKWLDQAQSLNLYMEEPSGKMLDNIYKLAWVRGLKTTYYLRSKGATGVENSTENTTQEEQHDYNNAPAACSILDPECEACQ